MKEVTHCAFSDESGYNTGRYRSIGMVSLPIEIRHEFERNIRTILEQSEVNEFKWNKLKTAKSRFCAKDIIDIVIQYAIDGKIRIDVLVWDTQDSRHKILGRDDIANLQRMYYHLLKNVLNERWPRKSVWELYPDKQSAIKWDTVTQILNLEGFRIEPAEQKPDSPFNLWLQINFSINKIEESDSYEKVIIQIADLFAGMGVYSKSKYDKYVEWNRIKTGQQLLIPQKASDLSKSDKEKCDVIHHLNKKCKDGKMGLSLEKGRCLRTFSPMNPINFWPYTPQTEMDKAPTKIEGGK